MDSIIIEVILIFIFILLAGYFSAAEISIASFGSNKIEELKEKKDKKVPYFEAIQKESNTFFGTIQILTSIFLMSAAIVSFHVSIKAISPKLENADAFIVHRYSEIISILIALAVVSFLAMIFGILIPKALGFKYAETIGKKSVRFLLILTRLLKIPVNIVNQAGNFFLIPFNEKTNFSQTKFSEDEIRIIISEGVKSGAIDENEQKIIENLFEFNDLRANEVMIPRTEMIGVDWNGNDPEITEEVIKTGHSLLPVYKGSPDNIIGVLHAKDLMRTIIEKKPIELKSLIRPAYFVPETKLISEILKEMQKRGERMAIVMDEYGGTEGIITMEDILEEIVGEFGDNTQPEIKEYSKLPDGKYYVLGSMTIDDFNEIFNMDLPYSDEYNTIAGFVADKTGKILNTGEVFQYEGLTFELIKKIRQKMVQFKIYSADGAFGESKT
ncbi:MAG: hemolysin family protein [Ignavibacteriaceae bacterium]